MQYERTNSISQKQTKKSTTVVTILLKITEQFMNILTVNQLTCMLDSKFKINKIRQKGLKHVLSTDATAASLIGAASTTG